MLTLPQITEFGWSGYLRKNPRPSHSLFRARGRWSPKTCAAHDTLTDRAWSRSEFTARPLARPWTGKLQPLLAINRFRLVVAAGSYLYLYIFGDSCGVEAPSIQLEGAYPLNGRYMRRDITGIAFVDDDGLDRTLLVGFQDGALERVVLPEVSKGVSVSVPERLPSTLFSQLINSDFIENLSSDGEFLLSLSSNGSAALTDLKLSPHPPSPIELKARSWVSHLCMQSSGPYAAFGTSSTTPLAVHSITTDRLSSTPYAILHTHDGIDSDGPTSSAVYGIARAPSSPWGSSPQIIVSGWFDGKVRCYDLRSSLRGSSNSNSAEGPAPLLPVLSLSDPWSYEAIYSVSCGGGSNSHIAAGTARHSVVSFWDVRSPKTGWSVHAPGNDPSPVYALHLESSRLFGVTQSRPFVYDFVSIPFSIPTTGLFSNVLSGSRGCP